MAEMEPKKSNICKFHYYHEYADTAATGSAMKYASFIDGHATRITAIEAPFDGSIVALSVGSENPVGTGSVSFHAQAGGSTTAVAVALESATNTATNYTAWRRGLYSFSAGDLLGCNYTSGGTFSAGASCALFADLYVHFEQN
jgi:hypothetical protein